MCVEGALLHSGGSHLERTKGMEQIRITSHHGCLGWLTFKDAKNIYLGFLIFLFISDASVPD